MCVRGCHTPPKLVKKQKIHAKIDSISGKIWFGKVGKLPFG